MTTTTAGAWGSIHIPTSEERTLFAEVQKTLLGVSYSPIAVQSQVVAGMNYRFYCVGTVVSPTGGSSLVRIDVYVPPTGKPVVVGITPIPIPQVPVHGAGGWTGVRTPTTEDLTVFNEALQGITGVGYTPIAVQSQVVAGMNYCFFCIATVVYPNAEPTLTWVSIYAAPGKKPVMHVIGTP